MPRRIRADPAESIKPTTEAPPKTTYSQAYRQKKVGAANTDYSCLAFQYATL